MRRIVYRRWDSDDVVSAEWFVILTAAKRAGVVFSINDGHRSWALQQQRVREHGVWSPSNPTGAARPSANAPHIWLGRCNHALDGNLHGLAAWLRKHGVTMTFPIGTEPWHGWVANEAALIALAAKLADPLAGLTPTERRLVTELDRLRKAQANLPRRRVLVRDLTRRRKAIWRYAQPRSKGGDGRGWSYNHRRARYAVLLARTKR